MTAPPRWLLALHSSTAELGVGLRRLDGGAADRIATFPVGRALANELFSCVEQVLPAGDWWTLARLAVATGPGGFTGTRLTVVLARTLAQQLHLPLDGVDSFLLTARRLALTTPTWLVQELPRRGLVAGLYGPAPGASASGEGGGGERGGEVVEWREPRLHADAAALAAIHPAPLHPLEVAVAADVAELLALAHQAHRAGEAAPWQPVLPIYPTSPVGVS